MRNSKRPENYFYIKDEGEEKAKGLLKLNIEFSLQ